MPKLSKFIKPQLISFNLLLRFCEKCKSKLFHTKDGLKCKKCVEDIPKKEIQGIMKKNYSADLNSYVKYEYYVQKEVRKALGGLESMREINIKKQQNIIIIFRNAHARKTTQNNMYFDHYDLNTGYYYYTGVGLEGDQTLSGTNLFLKNAKETNTKIYLFWQRAISSDHQYVGEVEMISVIPEYQHDRNDRKRKIYVFLLKPIQNNHHL